MTIQLGELLAEDARTADSYAGLCGICTQPIGYGARYARLLNGEHAHTPCVGAAAGVGR